MEFILQSMEEFTPGIKLKEIQKQEGFREGLTKKQLRLLS